MLRITSACRLAAPSTRPHSSRALQAVRSEATEQCRKSGSTEECRKARLSAALSIASACRLAALGTSPASCKG